MIISHTSNFFNHTWYYKFNIEVENQNLSKKERDKVDILMGKILSLESEIAWIAGSKFTAKVIFELLK